MRVALAEDGALFREGLLMLLKAAGHEIVACASGEPVDVVVRRDGDVLVLLVTGVAACHAASVHDGVRLLGGTVAVGGAGPTGAAGALITVRIPCA